MASLLLHESKSINDKHICLVNSLITLIGLIFEEILNVLVYSKNDLEVLLLVIQDLYKYVSINNISKLNQLSNNFDNLIWGSNNDDNIREMIELVKKESENIHMSFKEKYFLSILIRIQVKSIY